jgi:hypothetical protein
MYPPTITDVLSALFASPDVSFFANIASIVVGVALMCWSHGIIMRTFGIRDNKKPERDPFTAHDEHGIAPSFRDYPDSLQEKLKSGAPLDAHDWGAS